MTYYWIAKYNNGTEISSLDDNKYNNIDKGSLRQFVLLQVDNDKPVVTLEMGGNKRLVLFYRRCKSTNPLLCMDITIVGKQELIQGSNVQELHWVYPNGVVETTNGFKGKGRKCAPTPKHMERFDG